jgi:hypothetical protein
LTRLRQGFLVAGPRVSRLHQGYGDQAADDTDRSRKQEFAGDTTSLGFGVASTPARNASDAGGPATTERREGSEGSISSGEGQSLSGSSTTNGHEQI